VPVYLVSFDVLPRVRATALTDQFGINSVSFDQPKDRILAGPSAFVSIQSAKMMSDVAERNCAYKKTAKTRQTMSSRKAAAHSRVATAPTPSIQCCATEV
jgi:hypothetical protein